jgi:hypothetical protein
MTVIQIDPTLVIKEKEQCRTTKRKPNPGSNAHRPNRRSFSQNYQSTTDKRAEALEQIKLMKIAQKDPRDESGMIISPDLSRQAPVNHKLTGTETDSVGDKD